MKSAPAVEVGQVWEDWDSRFRDGQYRRKIGVEKIDSRYAYCYGISTGKRTRILLSRFRPTASGYRLVEGARHQPQ